VFCTWLLREGVSIDAIRELAGHRDRSTTDRYATLNRMEVSKYLSLLPKIRNLEPVETEELKSGKNWQSQEKNYFFTK
jgi:DNA-binding transcriptional MerR regulator